MRSVGSISPENFYPWLGNSMKPVYSYVDYREYMHDFYIEKKKKSRFSFREFSRLAGFSSPVFIKLVIEGKANLRKTSITRVCNAMGLKKEERRYFKQLVLFGQAKNLDTKLEYLENLKELTSTLHLDELSNHQIEYFSKWYHPVIKELLGCIAFDGDYNRLAALVHPPITPDKAEESVRMLVKLGLVREENGRYTPTHTFLTTAGLTIKKLAVRSVQKKLAYLAADALDTVPRENRDISGVLVSISPESIDAMREELARCRRRLLEIAAEDVKSNTVYRVNLHLFPVSKPVPDSLPREEKRKSEV